MRVHETNLEASGNLPAREFFALMASGALGPGVNQASAKRVYGYGPLRGHISLLTAFARSLNAKVVVELGTGTSIGTRAFMEACRHTGGHVWSVDHAVTPGRVELEGRPGVTFILGKTVATAKKWPSICQKPIDIVYVDGDHTRAGALADMTAWAALHPRMMLVDDTMDTDPPSGCPLYAVEDFCKQSGWTAWNIPIGTGLCVLLPGALPPIADVP